MSDILARYANLGKLGEGTYGIVHKGRDKDTNRIVALKQIRLDSADEGTPSTAIREVAILKQLQHPNIVSLLEIAHTESNLTLIFEFLDQDLHNYLEALGARGLDDYTVCSFLYQLLQGLAYCHHCSVLHRDLKPQNLLINIGGELKLADFGLARCHGVPVHAYTHEVVTLWYRPPDVLLGNQRYDSKIDLWGVGCIFAEMVTGRPLFPGSSPQDQLHRIFRVLGTPNSGLTGCQSWPDIESLPLWRDCQRKLGASLSGHRSTLAQCVPRLSPVGIDLLQRLLALDPQSRISAVEALRHPYFSLLQPAAATGTPSAGPTLPVNADLQQQVQQQQQMQAKQPTQSQLNDTSEEPNYSYTRAYGQGYPQQQAQPQQQQPQQQHPQQQQQQQYQHPQQQFHPQPGSHPHYQLHQQQQQQQQQYQQQQRSHPAERSEDQYARQ